MDIHARRDLRTRGRHDLARSTGDDEAVRAHQRQSRYGLTASGVDPRPRGRRVQIGDQARRRARSSLNRCDYLDPELAWVGVKRQRAAVATLSTPRVQRPHPAQVLPLQTRLIPPSGGPRCPAAARWNYPTAHALWIRRSHHRARRRPVRVSWAYERPLFVTDRGLAVIPARHRRTWAPARGSPACTTHGPLQPSVRRQPRRAHDVLAGIAALKTGRRTTA